MEILFKICDKNKRHILRGSKTQQPLQRNRFDDPSKFNRIFRHFTENASAVYPRSISQNGGPTAEKRYFHFKKQSYPKP